jgi:hypothetical protein
MDTYSCYIIPVQFIRLNDSHEEATRAELHITNVFSRVGCRLVMRSCEL